MQGCKDAETKRCRDVRMQRCRNEETQGHRDEEMQRCRNKGMQKCRDSGMQRCRNVGMQGLEMQGCRDSEMLSKCEQCCERFLGGYLLIQWPTGAYAFLSLHSHNTSLEHLPFKGRFVVIC